MSSTMSSSGEEQHTERDQSLIQGKRSRSPERTCVSMKSDQSVEPPALKLRKRKCSSELRAKRPDSAEPSCVSMKSKESMDHPFHFRKGNHSPDVRIQNKISKISGIILSP
ncbi:hypothetical protein SRHO_G00141220 [Serrasalmus rhombeus]